MSDKNQITYIIIALFALAFIGEYAILNNQIQNQIQTIEKIRTQLNEFETQFSLLTQHINQLETRLQQVENKFNATETLTLIDILELPGFSVIYSNNFEGNQNGSIPENWTQINGTSRDHVFASSEEGYNSQNSLKLLENGHDGDNCKARLDIRDCEANILLDMYLQVKGLPASRAIIHLIDEENETFASMNCLIDYRWGQRSPDYWSNLVTLPTPKWGQWYHVQIFLDRNQQKARYIVDGCDSGWLETQRPWNAISSVDFRGNYNYPAVSRIDNITIVSYTGEI
jgi:hypothetical protein